MESESRTRRADVGSPDNQRKEEDEEEVVITPAPMSKKGAYVHYYLWMS